MNATRHHNSVLSFASLDLATRQSLVLNAYLLAGVPLSDRQVAEWLGMSDLNGCRPRITEMLHEGLLAEVAATRCPVSGRRVRACAPTSLGRGRS